MENEINNFIKAVLHTEEGNKPIILSMKEKHQTKTILEIAEENRKVKKKTHTKKEKNIKKTPQKLSKSSLVTVNCPQTVDFATRIIAAVLLLLCNCLSIYINLELYRLQFYVFSLGSGLTS